jgi:hypothetical protein
MPAAHGAAECDACGAVWGQEHQCPHCGSLSHAAAGGEFRWACRDCGGIRLPPRVARIVGNDPDGSLAHLHRHYTAWSRKAAFRRRALLVTTLVAPVALLALLLGLLTGTPHIAVACLAAAVGCVTAGATFLTLRALSDRAEATAVGERGEIRSTYRRAVSMFVREEELTDDELEELVQSTRDIRRVRIAAGGLDAARVSPAPTPPDTDLATDDAEADADADADADVDAAHAALPRAPRE